MFCYNARMSNCTETVEIKPDFYPDVHGADLKEKLTLLLEKNTALATENAGLSKENQNLKNIIRCYEEKLKLANTKRYAPSSEQSEAIQFDFIGYDEDEDHNEAAATETITYERKKKSTGRKIDTSELPREVVHHDLADDERCCAGCNKELHKVGEDVSEKLVYVPATLKVIEHRRAKYSCRGCDTIKSAPKPESLVPKSMADNSLIIDVILAKYQRHMPLYRQSQFFKSMGLEIPDNTLGNWVLSAFDALAPISKCLWEQLDNLRVLQVDETPVKMLSTDKKGYMWVYHSCDPDNRFVLYDYNESRGAHVVDTRLHGFSGILQNDGYSGYNGQRSRGTVINVGCMAHCRRKFVDVIKVTGNKTGSAQVAMSYITKLYNIERAIKDKSHDERYRIRQQEAVPILEQFHAWLLKIQPKTPPRGKLGAAISYSINQWPYLSEYANHGEVEIDNNWVENKIRPFAVGRKNWLFVGNQRGADAAAFFFSLIESCKLNDIEPRAYLSMLFEKAADARRGEVDPKYLLPQNFKTSN